MARGVYVGAPNFEPVTLPSGYTQLEYLQSTGTQYIDTGFKPNQNTRVVCKTVCQVSSTANWVFGARTSSSSNQYTFLGASAGTYASGFATAAVNFPSSLNTTKPIVVDKNKTVTTINGGNAVTNTSATFTAPVNLALFAVNTNGTISYGKVKLYYVQIYDNGTLIRNMVPVKNSSGTLGMYDTVNGVFYANVGSGTFSAGGTYAEVARKVSKIYLGIDNIARKVKKGYIGDANGLARLFYAGIGKMSYYGTTPVGISNRYYFAATTIGDYALFGGGIYSTTAQDTVDAYNKSLVHSTPTVLSKARRNLSAATIGNYALFAGGYDIYGYSATKAISTVDAYNQSLTRSTPSSLNTGYCEMASAVVGNYALFVGGGTSGSQSGTDLSLSSLSTNIHVYNTSLTYTYSIYSGVPSLSEAKRSMAGATTGNYAIFAGGCTSSGTSLNSATAINASLTQSTPSSLSTSRYQLAGARVGNYALFAGGRYSSTYTDTVDAYDSSLTRSLPTALSSGRSRIGATSIGDYAIFAGGYNGSAQKTVDAYDPSLTRSILTSLPLSGSDGAATAVGDYALFSSYSSVYAYKYS